MKEQTRTKWKYCKSRKNFQSVQSCRREKILRTRDCHREFIKNLLPGKREENM